VPDATITIANIKNVVAGKPTNVVEGRF